MDNRQRRRKNAFDQRQVQIGLWVGEIRKKMVTGISADQAYDQLKAEVEADLVKIQPQLKAAYEIAWLEFKRKVSRAKA